MARSTVYEARARGGRRDPAEPKKRGPKTQLTDTELVAEIRRVLQESDFLGEGHRKVRVRLRPKGIRVGKNRVLRLMRGERPAGSGATRETRSWGPEPQRPGHDG